MKNQNRIDQFLFYILAITILLLDGYIALLTVQKYAVIVRGMLGFAVIYFIVQKYIWLPMISSNNKKETLLPSKPPEIVKFLFFAFVVGILMIWSVMQIVYMLLFYIKGY